MTAIDTAGPIVLSKILGSLTGTSAVIATAAPAAAAGSAGSSGSSGSASAPAGTGAAASMPAGTGKGQPAGQPIPQYSTAFKMRPQTLAFLQLSIPDPTDWASVQAQIAAAEAQNMSSYKLTWSKGCWAQITYGTILTSNGQYTFISEVSGGAFDPKQ